jgi:hypothetical protein
MTGQHRVVFVLHREDLTGTLEAFAGEKDRLVNVVSGKGTTKAARAPRGQRLLAGVQDTGSGRTASLRIGSSRAEACPKLAPCDYRAVKKSTNGGTNA